MVERTHSLFLFPINARHIFVQIFFPTLFQFGDFHTSHQLLGCKQAILEGGGCDCKQSHARVGFVLHEEPFETTPSMVTH